MNGKNMSRTTFIILQVILCIMYLLFYLQGTEGDYEQTITSSLDRLNNTDTGNGQMIHHQFNGGMEENYQNDTDQTCDCLLDEDCFNHKSRGFLEYNKKSSNMCLSQLAESHRNVVITFVGDSKLQSFFPLIVELLEANDTVLLQDHIYFGRWLGGCDLPRYAISSELRMDNYKVQFFFRPVPNEDLFDLMKDITSACEGNPPTRRPYIQCPMYYVTDLHLHVLASCDIPNKGRFTWFKSHMSQYLEHLNNMTKAGVRVIYKRTDSYIEFFYEKNGKPYSELQYKTVKLWMDVIRKKVETYSGLKFWSSSEVFVAQKIQECEKVPKIYRNATMTRRLCGDGAHYPNELLKKEIQIIMNYICNSVLYKQKLAYCSN